MYKNKITMLFSLFLSTAMIGQNCQDYTNNFDFQLCWYKDFALYQHLIPNDTINSFIKYNKGLNKYLTSGSSTPWAGNYSPWISGGIAYRWRTGKVPHANNLLTWESLVNMPIDTINDLSPAEKLDIYLGNKDFRITWWELKNRGPERIIPPAGVEGFCNGVRGAGAILPEPINSVSVVSKIDNRIKLTFYPADLKALAGASFYWVEYNAQMGCPNNPTFKCNQPNQELNPAILDIALRLTLGNKGKVFIADANNGPDTYNQTFFGYERTIEKITTSLENPNYRDIVINLKVYSLDELYNYNDINSPTKAKIDSLQSPAIKIHNYRYSLVVDTKDDIKGGKWLGVEQPDFIWFLVGQGSDEFDVEDELVERILQNNNTGGDLNNKFLFYSPIYNLVKISSKPKNN